MGWWVGPVAVPSSPTAMTLHHHPVLDTVSTFELMLTRRAATRGVEVFSLMSSSTCIPLGRCATGGAASPTTRSPPSRGGGRNRPRRKRKGKLRHGWWGGSVAVPSSPTAMTLHNHHPCQARWSRNWSFSSYLAPHSLVFHDTAVLLRASVRAFFISASLIIVHLHLFVGLRPSSFFFRRSSTPRHGFRAGFLWRQQAQISFISVIMEPTAAMDMYSWFQCVHLRQTHA